LFGREGRSGQESLWSGVFEVLDAGFGSRVELQGGKSGGKCLLEGWPQHWLGYPGCNTLLHIPLGSSWLSF